MIKVRYRDNQHDTVTPWVLDKLIASNKIRAFQRTTGWAVIGRDRLRGDGGAYCGMDRRTPYNYVPRKPTYKELAQKVQELEFEADLRLQAEMALRKSKATLRSILAASPAGIGLVRHDRVFSWVSSRLNTMLGYVGDELLGKSARLVYESDEEFERVGREQYTALRARKICEAQTRWLRQDGGVIHVLLRATPIDPADLSTGVIFSALDVTEHRRVENEALKTLTLESLGILAGGIAHDFNNLLTAILANVTLAKRSLKPEDAARELLADTEKASHRARNLTRQLLSFSRDGSPAIKATCATDLIKDPAQFSLRGANVKCEFSIPDDLWPVEADEGQISRVIQNLVTNAKQAMAEGGSMYIVAENITVGKKSSLSLPKGRYVEICIRDEGMGIPEDDLDKIFDPYFTSKEKGSGLGLSLCYSIIKSHRGLITVDSEPGSGTTFHLYLPAAGRGKRPGKRPGKKAESKAVPGKGTVLVMDDEQILRDVARKVLRDMGYRVDVASDGDEALHLYKQAMKEGRPYDAVILDLTIPGGMGGKEAIARLREIDPQVKAIVSSGYAGAALMADFRQYGFSGIVPKPYKVDDLSRILHEVITAPGDTPGPGSVDGKPPSQRDASRNTTKKH